MRTAFINQLVEEAKTNEKIFLVVGDLGYHVVEKFRDAYPDRFLNAGIAEQDMMGIAAGLAKEGFNVYCYSIGNFPTLRCIEQIRYDVAYPKLSVKVVAVGAGYAYGSLGASHHATEEMGMMRTIPNMVVTSPGDPVEAQAITRISANYDGPMYLRLGKAGEKIVHSESRLDLKIGDIVPVSVQGRKNVILACGGIMAYADQRIKEEYLDADLYSLPFVKPINTDQLKAIADKYEKITVIEEHQKSCGAGSAVIEQLSDLYDSGILSRFPKVHRIAIPDKFYSVCGNQQYLREVAGLTL